MDSEPQNKNEAATPSTMPTDMVNAISHVTVHRLVLVLGMIGYIVLGYSGHMEQWCDVTRFLKFIVSIGALAFGSWFVPYIVKVKFPKKEKSITQTPVKMVWG